MSQFEAKLTESGIQIDTSFLPLIKFDAIGGDNCPIIFRFVKCMSC